MRAVASAAAVLVMSAMVMSACGGGGSPASPSPTVTGPVTVNIVGERGALSFSPNPVDAAGRMVVFRNTDTVVHRVRLNDLSIDTGDIAPGASSRPVLMPANGTNYHCFLHPGMTGGVSAGTAPPPPCSGLYC